MDVAAMTLDADLDEWLALLRMRIQPTTFRGYDDLLDDHVAARGPSGPHRRSS